MTGSLRSANGRLRQVSDGIVYEKGNQGRMRAVVMRWGIRVVGKWRRTKESALRSLVVQLALYARNVESDPFREEDERWVSPAMVSRDELADIIDSLAQWRFVQSRRQHDGSLDPDYAVHDDPRFAPFGVPVSSSTFMMRGARTLRWVEKRENERP